MDVAYLDESQLVECWSKGDPTARMRCSDALIFSGKADSSSLVHMLLEPGGRVPPHTDSAEEVVLVLEGTVEAHVGDESGTLEAGGMVLIPAMALHSIRNVGGDTARMLGFFSGAEVTSTFEKPLMPFDMRVFGPEGGGAPEDASNNIPG
jgi:quercetin dioxygenase-like cupin family protein